LQSDSDENTAGESHVDKFVAAIAADLVAHQGASVVAVGPQQPAEVHAGAHRLNALLGNVGKTVRYTRDPATDGRGHVESLAAVTKAMHDGSVDTLIVLGGNPVYNAPADLDFAGGLEKVAMSVHVGLYHDETAELCKWHVPQAHFLESWGDTRACDGTYSVVQPTIVPLYGGRTHSELIARMLGDVLPKPEQLVRETFKSIAGDKYGEKSWRRVVHDGFLADSAWPAETVTQPRDGSLPTELVEDIPENGSLELVFCRDASVFDGRFANSGWLQECPDPLTKLTWDNAALIGPQTAKALQVTSQTLATLQLDGRELQVPVYVMPGQAEGSIAIALGYGRTRAGLVGGHTHHAAVAPVGVNA
jgi:anaerobic selenocysteine-containing dehydrogenase